MVPPEICVSRKVGLGGVVLFPEQQGTGYPSLKPRYLFHSTPKHLPSISAETPSKLPALFIGYKC